MKDSATVFSEARSAWNAAASLRSTRLRLMRNTYGDQWSDIVSTPDGRLVTEFRRATESGMTPLTNNLLRSLVKTVVGRFRYNISLLPAPSGQLAAFRESNQLDELDSRAIEEFLISGVAVQKLVCERRPAGFGVWVDNVSPDNFFVNRFLDPRGNDIRLIGMVADMPLDEICLRFAHGSHRRAAEIRRLYSGLAAAPSLASATLSLGLGGSSADFLRPSDPALCRVIEVWSFDIDSADPASDPHWHCRFFAPTGELLDESRSLLPDGSHPFVVKLYPLTDGAVHPFIEDLVGQQKHINTLITTIDHILATSAKGVLLFPTDCLTPGQDIVMATEMWNKPGGVIPVNPHARQLPVEVTSPGHSEGAARLLENELKMFQSISGVTSALQGRAEGTNTSASLFESQVFNSAIALLDVYETFNSFRRSRDKAAMQLVNVISQ